MTQKIAWSWSRLETFEACPLKFQHMNILKTIPFVTNDAMERGKRIHKSLEDAVKLNAPLSAEAAHMAPVIDSIKRVPGASLITEDQVAFNESMQRIGYFDKSVWLRVIMDLAIVQPSNRTATILDWKTGKVRPYSDQLALSAMAGFVLWDDVDVITAAYVFVDHKTKTEAVFKRDQYDSLLRKFGDRSEMIQLAMESGEWRPTPNQYCKWCPLSPAQCPFKK